MVEIVLRPHQEREPDAELLLLERNLDAVMQRCWPERCFKAPFPRYFIKEYVSLNHRNIWLARHFQLIIIAFLLDRTINLENLPSPHDELHAFYKKMKEESASRLEQFLSRQPLHDAENVNPIQRILAMQLPSEVKERMIADLVNKSHQPPSHRITKD